MISYLYLPNQSGLGLGLNAACCEFPISGISQHPSLSLRDLSWTRRYVDHNGFSLPLYIKEKISPNSILGDFQSAWRSSRSSLHSVHKASPKERVDIYILLFERLFFAQNMSWSLPEYLLLADPSKSESLKLAFQALSPPGWTTKALFLEGPC